MIAIPKIPGKEIFEKYCHTFTSSDKEVIVACNDIVSRNDQLVLFKMGWKNVDKNWFLDYLFIG